MGHHFEILFVKSSSNFQMRKSSHLSVDIQKNGVVRKVFLVFFSRIFAGSIPIPTLLKQCHFLNPKHLPSGKLTVRENNLVLMVSLI